MSPPAALPPQSEAGAALTELILLVFRLNGRLLEAAERMAGAGELTAARWQVLGGVLDEPRSVSEIGRQMGLTRQSVQRLADALVAGGGDARARDGGDAGAPAGVAAGSG